MKLAKRLMAGQGAGDPHWANVVLYILPGSDIADVKSGKAITKYGGIATTTAETLFGRPVINVADTSKYFTLADSDDFWLPGDFTIDIWLKVAALANKVILARETSGNSEISYIRVESDGRIHALLHGAINYSKQINVYSPAISAGTWAHYRLIHSGTTYQAAINGVAGDAVTSSYNLVNSTNLLAICRNLYYGTSAAFTGYLGPIRITKGVARPLTETFIDIWPIN